ncbi:MAG: hypothetical protein KDD14_06930 [Saprospiraceae bacterium]|nr:hypothetical protein [Saprospiraceae bacterium]
MAENGQELQIFVASSAELMEERKLINSIFSEINSLLPHIHLKDIRWEKDMAGGSVEGAYIQNDINEKLLETCSVVILMLYSKIGKFTREEYELAIRKRKKLFVYFKSGFAPSDENQTQVLSELLRFKNQLNQENKVLYSHFANQQDLQLLLFRDLLHFLKDRYLLSDNSIMKLFDSLVLSDTENAFLDALVMLPHGAYGEEEIAGFFQIPQAERAVLHLALEGLQQKGILLPDCDSNARYRVQDIIRKNLVRSDLYDQDAFGKLVSTLVKRLQYDLEVFDYTRKLDNIRFVELLLRQLGSHAHPRIGQLKEELAVAYLTTFGTNSREHAEKAEMLLQQLLFDDQQNDENSIVEIRRKRLLSEVYAGLSDLFIASDRNRFLERAKAILEGIDKTQLDNPVELLRVQCTQLTVWFKLDGFTESARAQLEDLFSENTNYLDLLQIDELDLFLRFFYLSKNYKANALAETLILKVVALEEQEFGLDNFRLCKTYLNCGEILIINSKKSESIAFLRKALSLAEQASEDPEDLKKNINALIAVWTSRFVE